MKQFILNITSFTKRERRGAFFLVLILIVFIFINKYLPHAVSNENSWFVPRDSTQINTWLKELKERKLNVKPFNPNYIDMDELVEMGLPASICTNWIKYLDKGGKFYSKSDVKRLYGMSDSIFYKLESYIVLPSKRNYYKKQEPSVSKIEFSDFNPMLDSYKQLVASGLSKSVASNIVNYRESGGEFLVKTDLKKIYAINNTLYQQIESHIIIPQKDEQIIILDSVELNSTTYDELIALGINRKAASSLLGYREMLGGFYNLKQLKEVFNMDRSSLGKLHQSSWIDTLLIRQLNINAITESQLNKHPYISNQQANQIMKYKRFAEKIENYKEIQSLNLFSEELASKLRGYFAF